MGGSYGHMLVVGASRPEIVAALDGDPAYLASFGDVTAVFSEGAVVDTLTRAVEVSLVVAADVIGFSVVDDDLLASVVCRDGLVVAEVTVPALADYIGIDEDEMALMAEMLDEQEPGAGSDDDPLGFVQGVGRGDARRALAVLDEDYGGDGRVSATERHRELLAALVLPTAVVGWDYYEFEAGVEGFEGEAVRVSP